MALFDEKGRIFGKINIIDFFIFVIFLCLIPTFYIMYRIAPKPPKIIEIKSKFDAKNRAFRTKGQEQGKEEGNAIDTQIINNGKGIHAPIVRSKIAKIKLIIKYK